MVALQKQFILPPTDCWTLTRPCFFQYYPRSFDRRSKVGLLFNCPRTLSPWRKWLHYFRVDDTFETSRNGSLTRPALSPLRVRRRHSSSRSGHCRLSCSRSFQEVLLHGRERIVFEAFSRLFLSGSADARERVERGVLVQTTLHVPAS
jgi:hypothetical protein